MFFKIDSDFFTFKTKNIRIRYINELILASYKDLPKTLFGLDSFYNIEIENDIVRIPIDEWLVFHHKIILLFQGDERLNRKFFESMRENFEEYENTILELYATNSKNKNEKANLLLKSIGLFQKIHSYAVFNMLLPRKLVEKIFLEFDDSLQIDDYMISLIESHRITFRRKELSLIDSLDTPLFSEKLEKFSRNDIILSRYMEWNFFEPHLIDPKIITKQLRKKYSQFQKENIQQELLAYDCKNSEKIEKIYKKLYEFCDSKGEERKKIYHLLLLIVNISTQEELRHILDAYLMHDIGKFFFDEKIDPAKTSFEKIIALLSELN